MMEAKDVLVSILVSVLLFCFFATVIQPALGAVSIELEEFRWNRFPISVYVDLNQWSVPDYAVVIREALDNWLEAIWNYTNAYGGQSLAMISYDYYVSNANYTRNPDVIISFTSSVMSGNAVGLTTYDFDANSHEPVPPITINVTTYSGTAGDLFVEDVAMHEFGHVLGVGHASSPNTQNGPELMYYASSKRETVFPSTLDVYALTQLYQGVYNRTVQLPAGIPYVMLPEGSIPPPETQPWETYLKYLPLIAVGVLFILAIALIIVAATTRRKTDESQLPPTLPPPPPESTPAARVQQGYKRWLLG